MTEKTAAIQGERGSNSEKAAQLLLGDSVSLVFCASFAEAFEQLDQGHVQSAVLPVENTTAGLVQEVWDRLLGINPGPSLVALAEARVRISFVAAGLSSSKTQVQRILAHPVAAAQCRHFLQSSGWQVLPCHDTAGAARLARESGDSTLAALCPPGAAATYGLEVLAKDCGDSSRTWTRFLRLEPGSAKVSFDDDHTLLALTLVDKPGALATVLAAFSELQLNLAALHSRAIPGNPGKYMFLIELQAGASDLRIITAIEKIQPAHGEVRLMGSFKSPEWPAV